MVVVVVAFAVVVLSPLTLNASVLVVLNDKRVLSWKSMANHNFLLFEVISEQRGGIGISAELFEKRILS